MEDGDLVNSLTNTHSHSPAGVSSVTLNKLRTMNSEVEEKRTLLGQSWETLQASLAQYHASLVRKQEQFELHTANDESNSYIHKLESELERREREKEEIQSSLSDLELKVTLLQERNVSLTSDNEKLRDEVRIKENLIEKLQNQMTRESLEYSAEISALKESLSEMSGTACKRVRSEETSGVASKRGRVEEPAIVQKLETPSSCLLENTGSPAKSEAPSTFSMVTTPHLALPTTSTEALEPLNEVSYGQYEVKEDTLRNLVQPASAKTKKKNAGGSSGGGAGSGIQRYSRRMNTINQRIELIHPAMIHAHCCKVCGRAFGARYDLQRHERIHSGEKPYFCSECQRRFARKDHLRLHMVRVHGLDDGHSHKDTNNDHSNTQDKIEILIQGEDKDPLTVLREQQLAYRDSHDIHYDKTIANNLPMFPDIETNY